MLFIQCPIIDQLNALISNIELPDCKISGSLEIFLCKFDAKDKKLCKELESNYFQEKERDAKSGAIEGISKSAAEYFLSTSLEETHVIVSTKEMPFGDLDDERNRKMFYKLIFTLNSAFPDYDFSDVKPSNFEKVSFAQVKSHVDNLMLNHSSDGICKQLWETIALTIGNESNAEIRQVSSLSSPVDITQELSNGSVDIYRYLPSEYDPYSASEEDDECNDSIWSFNFLFYHRKHKRILFFTMHAEREPGAEEIASEIELEEDDLSIDGEASNIKVEARFIKNDAFRIPSTSSKKSLSSVLPSNRFPVVNSFNLKRKRQK